MRSEEIRIKAKYLPELTEAVKQKYGNAVKIEALPARPKSLAEMTHLGHVELIDIALTVMTNIALEEVLKFARNWVSEKIKKKDIKNDTSKE